MLTATYSLVAISAEQENTRSILSKLQQHIRSIWHDMQDMNRGRLEAALSRLEQFEEFCHCRKVEAYVIPAIRKTTHEADSILSELESLSSNAFAILGSMKEQLRQAINNGALEMNKFFSAMDSYCNKLLARLTKEEEELFPMARRLLPIEEWFQIAAKFLSEDARKRPVKG